MKDIKKTIRELQAQKYAAKDAVKRLKANDEYAGFYKGKVEAFTLCIDKLQKLLPCVM